MTDEKNQLNENDSEEKGATGPMEILFPAESSVLAEARRLVGDKNSRVDNLATACFQDPVLIIELLKKSNALFFAGGRAPITSPKTAIVRLGADVVQEMFDTMAEREVLEDPLVSKWLEYYRSRSKRTGIVSRLLSEALAKNLSEDCQAIGSLTNIGDMLAVMNFREEYTELAENSKRSGVNYKLSQNFKFDVDKMGVSYLRRSGIPEILLFVLDFDGRPRSQERAIMKPICQAAAELVDAFDANKWEKLAPGRPLSPKSALRMLQMSDSQYLKIYERASEYLFSAKMLEERQRSEAEEEEKEEQAEQVLSDEGLQDDILNILKGDDGEESTEEDSPADVQEQETEIKEIDEEFGELDKQFAFTTSKNKKKDSPRKKGSFTFVEPPKLRSNKGNEVVESISNMFEQADNSEELLSGLLQMLTDGPFEKAALIVVSHDRKNAIVVAARGPIGNGQKIELHDPLSPLAQCFSKVQSFSNRPNEASPFGSKAFALSPIDADHDTPVALYADCGASGSITFEARRVFRTVVEILNQKLPTLPGGIPVELESAR